MAREINYRPFTPYNDLAMSTQQRLARGYDFLPLLSYQQKLHGSLDVYYLYAMSATNVEGLTWGGSETVTPYGGVIRQAPSNTERTIVREGGLDPFDRSDTHHDSVRLSDMARGIFRPIRESELIIKGIGTVHELPSSCTDHPVTEGATRVAHEMTNGGNRSGKMYDATGIDAFFDPYSHVKDVFEATGQKTDVIESRLRGHNVTCGVMLDNGATHTELAAAGILRDILWSIHPADRDFTQDLGMPTELSETYGGRVFELESHDAIMTG